ncbi:MAG: AAA family ATPase [Bacteroidia bacterium]|nr:AAA family ATPase [Bacteroidia bacterium]
MKIKDIRQYRTFYKEQVNGHGSNRDEHFIGVTHTDGENKKWGYFSITHGDKEKLQTDGIRGFLEGFLDMARDAQAVYEFLQNSVDANSSRFAMFWGKDELDGNEYLLVLNNGKQFDFASVRSILNVGVSTKSSEEHTIGKFGIGFKLAHRLVGKDNGLEELLNKNYGPVLFSWKNSELKALFSLNGEEIQPTPQQYKSVSPTEWEISGNEPWLFKILITNFPCQPNETIKDIQYKEITSPFASEEIKVLSRWLNKYSSEIPVEEFQEGSLFFIRLGEDKKNHLQDANLKEGLRFSLSVLNHTSQLNTRGLKHMNLNKEELESVDLKFLPFTISKEKDKEKYNWIRFDKTENLSADEIKLAEKDSDIQFLMGFTSFVRAEEVFKNAPNFYLYFPLSEEKHNLKFIIHSNAFYKASHRTSLHIGSQEKFGINERLLYTFAKTLTDYLTSCANSTNETDKEKFKEIYSNLLLSDESKEPNRQWINKPLVEPIHKFLKENIPVKSNYSFELINDSSKVKIKTTKIPIDSTSFVTDLYWFYWSDDSVLKLPAISKLGISTFSIVDFLKTPNAFSEINKFIGNNSENAFATLTEIDTAIVSEKSEEVLKENLSKIKVFEFEDGNFLSIDDLKTNPEYSNHLIQFNRIDEISIEIRKAGFILSKQSLSQYESLYKFLNTVQILEYFESAELIKLLSYGFEKTQFTIEEKKKIFTTLEAPNRNENAETRNKRMKLLRLFNNKLGYTVELGQLIKDTQKSWLKSFCIDEKEHFEELDRYLVPDDKTVFTSIVIPLWDKFTEDKTGYIKSIPSHFFEEITKLQQETNQREMLSDRKHILIDNEFYKASDDIFYSPDLYALSDEDYQKAKEIFAKYFQKKFPDKRVLPYLKQPPFQLPVSDLSALTLSSEIEITPAEVDALAKTCAAAKLDLLEKFILQPKETKIIFRPIAENEKQIGNIQSDDLKKYVSENHAELVVAPVIKSLSDFIYLKDSELSKYLIAEFDFKDRDRTHLLCGIILSEDDNVKFEFINKHPNLIVEQENKNSINQLSDIVKTALSISDRQKATEILTAKILFKQTEGETFSLNNLQGLNANNIYFGENNGYSILLSELFKQDDLNKVAFLEKVLESLAAEISVEKLKLLSLFNLSNEVDKKDIFQKLNADYKKNGHLSNAAQLAFILLYRKFADENISVKSFKIKSGETTKSIDGSFGISVSDFGLFKSECYLPQEFSGVKDILKLSSNKPVFEVDSTKLYLHPHIIGSSFSSPQLKEGLSDNEQIELLELIEAANVRSDSLQFNQSWSSIFGFEIQHKVSSNFAYKQEEELPKHIDDWRRNSIDKETEIKKLNVLSSLGVQTGISKIVRLRRFLLDETYRDKFEVAELDSIPTQLLANTLIVCYSSGQDFSISVADKRFDVIKEVTRKVLNQKLTTYPLPVLNQELKYSLETLNANQDYYLDFTSSQNITANGVDKSELVKSISQNIYDATLFIDSPEIKSILKKIEIIPVTDFDKLETLAHEWNEKFYLEWKTKFAQYSIKFTDVIPTVLYLDSQEIKTSFTDGYVNRENTVYVSSKFSFDEIKVQLIQRNLLPEDAIKELIVLHEAYKLRIREMLETPMLNIDESLREELEKLKEKAELLAEKKDLKESLGREKYSYKWFIDFLQLECLHAAEADSTSPEKEISFFAAEKEEDSERIIILRDPNRTVTPTLEFCADFHAKFYRDTGSPIDVKIQGVSKKGQTVLAILANPNDLRGIDIKKEIKRIELRFSRSLDLLQKLLNSFRKLGYDKQWEPTYSIKDNLTENIQFIFGPPGTGKTTTIVNRVIEIMQNEPQAKILILTPTNKAADVVAHKIFDKSRDDYDWLVRYGATFNEELIQNEVLKDANSFLFSYYSRCTVVATIQRFPYEEFIDRIVSEKEIKIRMCDTDWDYIIFDEASMIPVTYIAFGLMKCFEKTDGSQTKFLIGGDPKQIPPVITISDEDLPADFEKEENIYSMIGLDSFIEEEQAMIPRYGDKIQNLKTQYRSTENIGKLFSHFSYGGKLSHHRLNGTTQIKSLPKGFASLGIKPISIIRFPVNLDESVYRPEKLRQSPYHLYSALLLLELIRKFDSSLTDKDEDWTIGIICPYRSQATLVNKMIESLTLNHKMKVITDTVHGFQGDECDLVFFLMNPSNYSISSDARLFLHKHYLINVAISRAMDYLIILYPDEHTQGIEKLYKIHKDHFGSIEYFIENLLGINLTEITIQSSDIEQKLFNEINHIEKNIFTNKHQLVNVYHLAEKKYLVKDSSTAIDIQFKL